MCVSGADGFVKRNMEEVLPVLVKTRLRQKTEDYTLTFP
jgi:hypothetical protein